MTSFPPSYRSAAYFLCSLNRNWTTAFQAGSTNPWNARSVGRFLSNWQIFFNKFVNPKVLEWGALKQPAQIWSLRNDPLLQVQQIVESHTCYTCYTCLKSSFSLSSQFQCSVKNPISYCKAPTTDYCARYSHDNLRVFLLYSIDICSDSKAQWARLHLQEIWYLIYGPNSKSECTLHHV